MAHLGLERVEARIAEACDRSGRSPSAIDVLVVSKNRSDDEVRAVYDAGQRLFAENREQGLRARMDADLPHDIEWHFVGPLQSRKVAFVGGHVALLHSMDRPKLARVWAERSSVPVLIQFNLGAEPQKSGFAPDDPLEVLDLCRRAGLTVRGVMAIPPLADDPEDVRPYFARLRSIFDRYVADDPAIDVCSMGMTNDLEVAVEEGSTMVRVGRAIFD